MARNENEKIRIEIGVTDDYGYIGITPPITSEQAALLGELEIPNTLRQTSGRDQHPVGSPSYTEFGYATTLAPDKEKAIRELAERIKTTFEPTGQEVIIFQDLRPITNGRHFFAGKK